MVFAASVRQPSSGWPAGLNVDSLREQGWRSAPFQQFIIKVNGRCDLACDYCYVFEAADQSWRDKPARMTAAIADLACDRIIEHAEAHALPEIAVVMHGGEPLLAPQALFERVAGRLRAGLPAGVRLDLRVQSNGVSLTPERLDALLELGFRFGISLDGDAVAHDRHRRFANGRGSFAKVDAALRLLATRPGALTGLLCTVDLANDPLAVFETLLGYQPPAIDFLLPHGNWDTPPVRPAGVVAPYGDWLIAVFDSWYGGAAGSTSVRLFAEILHVLLGGASATELIGLSPNGVVVVDTDGSIEQIDTLKSAYHGAAATGLTVRDHSFDQCLTTPGVVARQIGARALGDACQSCPVRDVCGGGYYPHRYRSGSGFRNPSVYCADLQRLILHIEKRVRADLQRMGLAG